MSMQRITRERPPMTMVLGAMTFKIVVVCLNHICDKKCLVERKPFPVRSRKGFFVAW